MGKESASVDELTGGRTPVIAVRRLLAPGLGRHELGYLWMLGSGIELLVYGAANSKEYE